jgi:hypothetical protein
MRSRLSQALLPFRVPPPSRAPWPKQNRLQGQGRAHLFAQALTSNQAHMHVQVPMSNQAHLLVQVPTSNQAPMSERAPLLLFLDQLPTSRAQLPSDRPSWAALTSPLRSPVLCILLLLTAAYCTFQSPPQPLSTATIPRRLQPLRRLAMSLKLSMTLSPTPSQTVTVVKISQAFC